MSLNPEKTSNNIRERQYLKMEIKKIIEEFIKSIKCIGPKSDKAYNEFGFQFELAFYLRKKLGKNYKINLERNISCFKKYDKKVKIKREIDLVIYKHNNPFCAIELKINSKEKKGYTKIIPKYCLDIHSLEIFKNDTVFTEYLFIALTDEKGIIDYAEKNNKHSEEFEKLKLDWKEMNDFFYTIKEI